MAEKQPPTPPSLRDVILADPRLARLIRGQPPPSTIPAAVEPAIGYWKDLGPREPVATFEEPFIRRDLEGIEEEAPLDLWGETGKPAGASVSELTEPEELQASGDAQFLFIQLRRLYQGKDGGGNLENRRLVEEKLASLITPDKQAKIEELERRKTEGEEVRRIPYLTYQLYNPASLADLSYESMNEREELLKKLFSHASSPTKTASEEYFQARADYNNRIPNSASRLDSTLPALRTTIDQEAGVTEDELEKLRMATDRYGSADWSFKQHQTFQTPPSEEELKKMFIDREQARKEFVEAREVVMKKRGDFFDELAAKAGIKKVSWDGLNYSIEYEQKPMDRERVEELFGQLAQGYGELYAHPQSKEAMAKIREVEEQLDGDMKILIAEEERYNRLVEDSKHMDRLLRDAKDYWTWLTYSGDAGKKFLQTRFPILQKFFAHAPDELKEAFQTHTAPIDKELPYEEKQAIRDQRKRDFEQALDAQKSKDAPSQAEVATAERLSRSFDYLASLFIQALQVGSPLEQLEQAFKERDRVRISQLAALNAIKEKELAWFVDTLDRAGLTKEG